MARNIDFKLYDDPVFFSSIVSYIGDWTRIPEDLSYAYYYIGDAENLCILDIQDKRVQSIIVPRKISQLENLTKKEKRDLLRETKNLVDGYHLFDLETFLWVMAVSIPKEFPNLNWELFKSYPLKELNRVLMVNIFDDGFIPTVAHVDSYVPRIIFTMAELHKLIEPNGKRSTDLGAYSSQRFFLGNMYLDPLPFRIALDIRDVLRPSRKKAFIDESSLVQLNNLLKVEETKENESQKRSIFFSDVMYPDEFAFYNKDDIAKATSSEDRFLVLIDTSDIEELDYVSFSFGKIHIHFKNKKIEKFVEKFRKKYQIPQFISINTYEN